MVYRAQRGLMCAVIMLGPVYAHAQSLTQAHHPLSINSFDQYISGQHNFVGASVIDPYTGKDVELGTTLATEYTAPYMSYLRESQGSAPQAISYAIGSSGLSLNYDPNSGRIHSEFKLTSSERRKFRLRLKPKEIKAIYTYKFN